MWNTGCIFTLGGRSSLYARSPIFSRMVYGPMSLKLGLLEGQVVFMFFHHSHTLSLGFRMGSGCLPLLACSA
jgi:hypothetical protein